MVNKKCNFGIIRICVSLVFIVCFQLKISAQTLQKEIIEHNKSVIALKFNQQGTVLGSLSSDKTIKIWDTEDFSLIATLYDNQDGELGFDFIPNSNQIVSCSWDKDVKLWDIASKSVIKRYSGHTAAPRGVCLHSNRQFFVSGGWDKDIVIWHKETGVKYDVLKGHTQCIRSLDVSLCGKYIASGGYDEYLKIWSFYQRKEIVSTKAHKYPIEDVAFSPNSKYVATGSKDEKAKIWQLPEGKLVRTLSGHSGTVYAVCFSPDSKYVATGSSDNTVKIWQVATGKLVSTLKKHTYAVKSLVFSPNGKFLISAGDDNRICVWNVEMLDLQPVKSIENIGVIDSIKWLFPNIKATFYIENINLLAASNINLNNYRLFMNGSPYTVFDKATTNKKEVLPQLLDDKLKFAITMPDGNSDFMIIANDNTSYGFSKNMPIKYQNADEFKLTNELQYICISNIEFEDKKINKSVGNNEKEDTFLPILQGNASELYHAVNIFEHKNINNDELKSIFNNITKADNNKKKHVFCVLKGIFIKSLLDNNIYFLPANADRKDISTYIKIQDLLAQVKSVKSLVLFFDPIQFVDLPIKEAEVVSAESLFDYLNTQNLNFAYAINSNYGNILLEMTKLFDKYNDTNSNNRLEIFEIIKQAGFLYKKNKTNDIPVSISNL